MGHGEGKRRAKSEERRAERQSEMKDKMGEGKYICCKEIELSNWLRK
jgi:hypothetical protein